jgi:hypothetical protein
VHVRLSDTLWRRDASLLCGEMSLCGGILPPPADTPRVRLRALQPHCMESNVPKFGGGSCQRAAVVPAHYFLCSASESSSRTPPPAEENRRRISIGLSIAHAARIGDVERGAATLLERGGIASVPDIPTPCADSDLTGNMTRRTHMTDDGTRTRYRDGVDVEYHIAKLLIAEMHFISIYS